MTLRAGFAERDVTPALGLPLGGYGARLGGADAVLDPLSCRAVVLDDGASLAAIVVLDLVHVFGPWVTTVRERAQRELGLDSNRLLVAATHTHAGPAVFRSSIDRDARLVEYEDALVQQVLACLTEAQHMVRPARIGFGSAPVSGVAANRRDPSLRADQTMRVLCAHSLDGPLLGVLANFACHPTILPATNHSYSADLFGAACAHAAELLRSVVLLTNGAAGDVSTRFTRRAQTVAELHRMGRVLAESIATAVRNASPVRLGSTPFAAARLRVPVRRRALPAAEVASAELQAAVAELGALKERGADPGALRLAQSRVEGAQAALWISSQGGWEALFGRRAANAELQALRCGDVVVVAAPGELFDVAGAHLRRRLCDRALVVGYANDYLGYFIPEIEARAGGYEALIAMVDSSSEAAIRRGLFDVAKAAGYTAPGCA
jgi:Neutral/alkaline non-lysosomal ceramidase, N-terminal